MKKKNISLITLHRLHIKMEIFWTYGVIWRILLKLCFFLSIVTRIFITTKDTPIFVGQGFSRKLRLQSPTTQHEKRLLMVSKSPDQLLPEAALILDSSDT